MANVRPLVRKNGVMTQMRAGVDTIDPALFAVPGGNLLINGDFDYWQRGVNFYSALGYGPDRWFYQQGSVSGGSFNRLSVGLGDTNFAGSSDVMRVELSGNDSATNTYQTFEQRIEDVNVTATKPVTTSFVVVNNGAAGRKIAIEYVQVFGKNATGAAPVFGIGSATYTLAAGYNYIQHTATPPSVAGKSFLPGHSFVVVIWTSAGSNFNSRSASLGLQTGQLLFGKMKVEIGSVATPFVKRDRGEEFRLCQRYYEKSYDIDVPPGANANNGRFAFSSSNLPGGTHWATVYFKVQKRDTPAITIWPAPQGPAGNVAQDNGVATSGLVENIGQSGYQVAWSNDGSRFGGWWNWVADAEL
ncbi:putative glycoprotein [Stenotrophomonas phage YB07]|uniref:Putative glycoprotein n=1 Tax=Stenotrophomonas phage YB07 TaxID=2555548 RepID=A0A482ID43_9CAUD|nr:putative glycoprotein [Stenotrophomonas phage YB07]QBP06369.1 putative glycoprotein [Stenotrophomonas phage YB07]